MEKVGQKEFLTLNGLIKNSRAQNNEQTKGDRRTILVALQSVFAAISMIDGMVAMT